MICFWPFILALGLTGIGRRPSHCGVECKSRGLLLGWIKLSANSLASAVT